MFEESCIPRLHQLAGSTALARAVYRTAGLPESILDARIAPIYTPYKNPETTILAKPGQVEIRLTSRGKNRKTPSANFGNSATRSNRNSMSSFLPEIRTVARTNCRHVLGHEECDHFDCGIVHRRYAGRAADECAGSSRYFVSGVICYSDEWKMELAGIPPLLLKCKAAVSAEVAQGLAEGIRSRMNTTIGVGVTGIAGPTGGSPKSRSARFTLPSPHQPARNIAVFQFPGDREKVRWQASQAALDMVRRELMKM